VNSETAKPNEEPAIVQPDASVQASAPGPDQFEPQPTPGVSIPQAAVRGPFANTPSYLLDVKLTVSAEVGRVQIPVREIMDFGPGSLIELQRSAAEPVEIFANGRCIGRGEIVVIGEQFGVRVTDLGAAA
jgi:flagellar motor switch protein FliN/FliY